MNFELEAKWINEFKSMLDMDERVIRHLVIKRDTAITEDCPPPPEFHTLRAGIDDDDDNEEDDMDDYNSDDEMEWDDEAELDDYDEGLDDGIIIVDSDNDTDDNSISTTSKSTAAGNRGLRNRTKK